MAAILFRSQYVNASHICLYVHLTSDLIEHFHLVSYEVIYLRRLKLQLMVQHIPDGRIDSPTLGLYRL